MVDNCWLQLRVGDLDAALRGCPTAADAAQRAALAEAVLLWGGALFRLRPLPQVARLVADASLQRLPAGGALAPAAGKSPQPAAAALQRRLLCPAVHGAGLEKQHGKRVNDRQHGKRVNDRHD